MVVKKTQLFYLFLFFFEPSKVLIFFFSFLEIGFLPQSVDVSNLVSIDGRKLIIASHLRSLSVSTFGNDRPVEGTGS